MTETEFTAIADAVLERLERALETADAVLDFELKDAGVLEIEFASGSIVQYSGVSEEIYRRLMNSPSAGSYFRDSIEENFAARRIR